jgi:tRNA-2-methylthio-N6-dimethylallyladenosine synthase
MDLDRTSDSDSEKRRVYIQNFGCQMNEYDVARMIEVLRRDGFEAVDSPDDADLVILNSCSIREKSEHKVQSAAGRLRELKEARREAGRQLTVAIGGCVAQQEGQRLLRRVPTADFTFGPDLIPSLTELVARHRRERRRFALTEVIDVEDYEFLDADPLPGEVQVTALVTIQKGCDNHCAYCVVPATRGREVSRPADEVVAEVARFVALGAREVTLIGQNVNSYRGVRGQRGAGGSEHARGSDDADDFAELLRRVDAVPGLVRIRYTTSHPKDFTKKVADAHASLPRLMPWLHLPVQSGSSRTLRRMVRGYTREQYIEKLDYARKVVPDLSLSTDIIVGYPGETDADFEETLSLLRYAEYDSIYSFEYSERPDTPALKLKLKDDVPAPVKAERLQVVQALQREISVKRMARHVGRVGEVLVEGRSRRGEAAGAGSRDAVQLCGRLPGNEMVHFEVPAANADALVGRVVPVRVTSVGSNTLGGELAGEPRPMPSSPPMPPPEPARRRGTRLPVLA